MDTDYSETALHPLKNSTMLNKAVIIPALIILLALSACGPSRELAEDPAEEEIVEEIVEEEEVFELLSAEDLAQLRNTLADPYLQTQNEVSPVFELTDEDLEADNSRNGFRIQILSTEDMNEADAISLRYYDWADNRDLPFIRAPEAYVLFRQPYYRVRVGDFRNRADVIEFLELLRPRFPGSWIVLDTIDPDRVPRRN